MRLEYFHYLSIIQECGSISAAAKQIHMSHQGLSLAIKALEEELSIILLSRTTAGVALTVEGQYVLDAYLEFSSRLQRAHSAVKPLQGILRLGCVGMATECFLPPVLGNFYQDYPQVQVTNKIFDSVQTILEYQQGNIDLAVIAPYSKMLPKLKKDYPDLKLFQFSYFDPCIEISKFSPLAKYKAISLDQLKPYKLIFNCAPNIGQDSLQASWFRIFPGTTIIFEPIRGVYEQLILSDIAVGISSTFEQLPPARRLSDKLIYIPILEDKRRYVAYLQEEGRIFSPEATAFIEELRCIYPNVTEML